MNLEINLTPLEEKLATQIFDQARAKGETKAETLREYLESLLADEFQIALDARITEVVKSWAPVDAPEVQERKDALVEKLPLLSADKLAAIEAIIDSDTAI